MMGDQGIWFGFPAGHTLFSSLQPSNQIRGPPVVSVPFSPTVYRLGRAVRYSLPSNAEVKNGWSYVVVESS